MQDKQKCAFDLIRDDFKSRISISYTNYHLNDVETYEIIIIDNVLKISFNLKALHVLYLDDGKNVSKIIPYYQKPFINSLMFYESSLDEEVLPFE